MIKGIGVSLLDGSFQYQPHKFSVKIGGTWHVVLRGQRYVNTYEVMEYDEAGLAWLEKNEAKEAEAPTP